MKTVLSLMVLISVMLTGCQSKKDTSIKPGEVWLDVDGNPINAHGGGLLYHQGMYYWYGEIKEGETYLPDCNKSWGGTRVDVTGVSCYSSKDLVNWKNEGIVLTSVKDDPSHDLYKDNVLERPKVVYNAKTKKFVLWVHVDSMDYQKASCGVAVSDNPTGPFVYQQSIRPNANILPLNVEHQDSIGGAFARDFEKGQMARDMTVFVDDDNKAYLFYSSEENKTHQIAELSDDYLSLTGKYKRVFEGRSMEAPAVFKRNGKYYFMASGCTAWEPNPARSAVAESIWGPWKELGNPCVGEGAEKTFISQSTYILPIQGKKDAYIFMADRWNKDDLPDSRYIWLPLRIDEEEKLVLQWHDEWDLAIFDK
ncbi:glycosyl hydrolase family 43 [Labilibacter sediminis]|nr:glycosyl hydrolase family 43 [Labilibacter sediminis]